MGFVSIRFVMQTIEKMPSTATTTVDDNAPRLNVSDLFNAQAAQATYQRLVDVINQQAAQVAQLLKRVASLEATQQVAVTAQHQLLQHMDVAVGQLERLQVGHGNLQREQRTQRAELDDVNSRVNRHEARLSDTATRLGTLESVVADNMQQQQMRFATIDAVSHLEESQYVLDQRVSTLQSQLSLKLDKSESPRLESVVAKINAFAPTANTLTNEVADLKATQKEIRETITKSTYRIGEVSATLSDVQYRLRYKLDTDDWTSFCKNDYEQTVATNKSEVARLDRTLTELVHRWVTLDTSYRSLSSKVASVSVSFTEQIQTTRHDLQATIDTRVPQAALDTMLKEMQRELSCKAWRQDTLAIADDVKTLQDKLHEVEQRATLSTRFVEWFASRGEAYERNLDVVEQQLGRLAHHSAPERRQPDSSRLRYE